MSIMLKAVIIALSIVSSGNNTTRIDTERISQLLNFWENQYTNSTWTQIEKSYKGIGNIDFAEYTPDQQRDIILILGINKDCKYRKIIDKTLLSTHDVELRGVCFFYKYQGGADKYLSNYLTLLKQQCDSVGDTGLLQALAYIKEPAAALKFLNDNITKYNAVGKESMIETLEVLKIRLKGKIDQVKYPNLREYIGND
jgi:hypothetical protein